VVRDMHVICSRSCNPLVWPGRGMTDDWCIEESGHFNKRGMYLSGLQMTEDGRVQCGQSSRLQSYI